MTPAHRQRSTARRSSASTWPSAASRDRADPSSPRRSTPSSVPEEAAEVCGGDRAHLSRPRTARGAQQVAAGLPDRRVGRGALPQGARGAPGPAAAPRRPRRARRGHERPHRRLPPAAAGTELRGAQDAGGTGQRRSAPRAGAAGRVVRPGRAALHALAERAHSAHPRRAARRPDAGAAAQGAALQPVRGRARARLVHRHGLLQPGPDRHEDARDGARPRALAEARAARGPSPSAGPAVPPPAATTTPPTSGSRAARSR